VKFEIKVYQTKLVYKRKLLAFQQVFNTNEVWFISIKTNEAYHNTQFLMQYTVSQLYKAWKPLFASTDSNEVRG
jgi:hypothetical protein